jgi:hypothetical protein
LTIFMNQSYLANGKEYIWPSPNAAPST